MAAIHRLTGTFLTRHRKPGMYADGNCLYLRIANGGRHYWIFRYRKAGRLIDLSLGPSDQTDIVDARATAARLRGAARRGVDPRYALHGQRVEAKAAVEGEITFAEAVEQVLAKKDSEWTNPKHRAQWEMTLRKYANPTLGSMPVRSITTLDVARTLNTNGLWTKRPETARRLRSRIAAVIAHVATPRGWTTPNPARWRDNLDAMMTKRAKNSKAHLPAMPFADVPAFVERLSKTAGVSALALRLTILTAARSGETRGMTWEEVDLEAALWRIPAERMKAGRKHEVPLSPQAVETLRAMLPLATVAAGKPTGLIFTTNKKTALSDMSLAMCLRRQGIKVTVHGFRSSFRDWVSEKTAVPPHVAELCLAHAVGSQTERAYSRATLLDHRRDLMCRWADYVCPSGSAAPSLVKEAVS